VSPKAAPPTSSPKGKVVALAPWTVSSKVGDLVCEVSQKTIGGGSITVLTIYQSAGTKLTEIFSFKTLDSIVNIYQIGDYKGRLFTTWVGGSAYHVRVWAFADGRVKPVFDQGTKVQPELVYDDQGRESILLTDPSIENGKWTTKNGTTTVFRWNGENYSKVGTVAWMKRFQCVFEESCR
jgi:hypothetical protein